MPGLPEWLDKAIFYEIYPQSFFDSNADGIGDIPGIQQKLDYIQSLGVNAIWLNPCFASPFKDAGYDVADYCSVAPRYGTNNDLLNLFNAAHSRGLRVLLDLVPGHTSTDHPWFVESCKSEPNSYTDYYIWTDSVWNADAPGLRTVSGYAERDGAYVTNFFHFQPALNYGFANPDPRFPWQQGVDDPGPRAVRQEMKETMRFWLKMGADGFRVDMAHSLVKNDPGWRQTSRIWQEIRAWLEKDFPEAVLVSEWGVPSQAIPAGFHMDFLLHFSSPGLTSLFRKPYGPYPWNSPYSYSFFDRSGHGNIQEFLADYYPQYLDTRGHGHIALITGNHDITPRLSFNRETNDLVLIFLFLLTMPGTPYIYYGDEIGMQTSMFPSKEGGYARTGVRTPMQWNNSVNAGFSAASSDQLYLPVADWDGSPNVASQEEDTESLLNQVRRLIAIRLAHPALHASGNLDFIHANAGSSLLVYTRRSKDEIILVAINPSGTALQADLPSDFSASDPELIFGKEHALESLSNKWRIALPPVTGVVYKL